LSPFITNGLMLTGTKVKNISNKIVFKSMISEDLESKFNEIKLNL
jgi:hypothetical protein